jgi:hypothetical protein
MSRARRFTFLAIAVVIAVVAVILLTSSTGDDEETAATPTPTATATAEPGADETPTPEPTPEPTPKPTPPPLIEPGKLTKLEFTEGDEIVFRARADEPSEIHIHGYDIEKEIGPDPTRISFPATITGIFEIEIHDTGEQIAELRVDPK